MKGKQMTIRELENKINEELKQLDGRKYEGTDHFSWSRDLIQQVLVDNDIQEMKTYLYWITLNIENPVLSLGSSEHIATIHASTKADKRIKYGAGRGTINNMVVAFDNELLDMTMDEARKHLVEKKRAECLERLKKYREDLSMEMKMATTQIIDLMAVEI